MAILAREKLNIMEKEICKVLGLNPKHVTRIVVDFKAGEYPCVQIFRMITLNEENGIYRAISEAFDLIPKTEKPLEPMERGDNGK